MGATYSLMAQEKITWDYHCLLFDEVNRKTNLNLIDVYFPDNSEIQLAKQNVCIGGLKYEHFFITDIEGAHFLELSSSEQNPENMYETFRVQCNTLPHAKGEVCGSTERVTPEIKERMSHLLGMCNYSLCLRNSEHVANYIFSGKWASFQMEGKGALADHFESIMTENQRKKINVFPSTIKPKTMDGISGSKLYSMIDKRYVPVKFQYFADAAKDSYNVLVVGKGKKTRWGFEPRRG